MFRFKPGHYIDEKTLTEEEAVEFILFLESEVRRHEEHMEKYQFMAKSDNVTPFTRVVALTVVSRNVDDIKHTQKTIDYLKAKFPHWNEVKEAPRFGEFEYDASFQRALHWSNVDDDPIEGC